MDKNDFKKVIKPLLKECLKEILVEQGLTKLISETVATTHQQVKQPIVQKNSQINAPQNTKQTATNENHRLMMEQIGKSVYLNNSFNPFANTQALSEAQAGASSAPSNGPLANIDPNDSGVDISDFMSGNKNVWKALVGGKGK